MAKQRRPSLAQRTEILKRYRQRVDASIAWRQKEEYDALWKRLTDIYRGKHFTEWGAMSNEDRIAVNLCFSTINVIAPSVSINHPKIAVSGRGNQDGVKAVLIETVINYWWGRYDFQEEVALAVKDWLVIGHGWLKVGWRFVEERKRKKREYGSYEDDHDGDDANDTDLPQDENIPAADEPDSSSADEESEFEVTEDRPFVERVSPKDIYVDPEAKTLKQAKWIAQKLVRPLEEVRRDTRYNLKARQGVKPDAVVNPDWRSADFDDDQYGDDIKRVTLWEFYDMCLGTMCVFSNIGDDLLLDPIPQPYAFGHPFVMLRNYDVPDYFYPVGDIEELEPLQNELNKTRSQMMNQRKRYNRKWIIREEAFDAQAIEALETDQDNVFVTTTSDEDFKNLNTPIPQEMVNPQFFPYAESIESDMDRVSGISEYQNAQAPEVRKTATEASMISDAAQSRAADKLKRVENVIAHVAMRVIQLAQEYMTQEGEARITGDNGHPQWVPYTRRMIQGEFDFLVEAGSTQPLNESMRRQQALQMLQVFTPYATAGLVNIKEFLRYTLTFGFQVKDPDRFLTQVDPNAGGEQQKHPKQTIIESLAYDKAPADIQRQMEAQAGFQPSTIGGSSPAEAHIAKMAPTVLGQQAQAAQQQQQGGQQQQQAAMQQAQAQQQMAHEAQQAHADRAHEVGLAAQEHAHAQQQAAMAHQQAMQQAEQAAQHGQAQTLLQGAMQPEQPETQATQE